MFARGLFGGDPQVSVAFHRCSALRFSSDHKYALVWSAGLFDYFDEPTFVEQARRYYAMVEVGGELVIGNFSELNPSRAYMEVVGDWHLQYRNEDQLRELAVRAGIPGSAVRVGLEPHGINLFLHARK